MRLTDAQRIRPRWAALAALAVAWIAAAAIYVDAWLDVHRTLPGGLPANPILAWLAGLPRFLLIFEPNLVLLALALPLGFTRRWLPWEDRPTFRRIVAAWTAGEAVVALLALSGGSLLALSASAAVGALLSAEGVRLTSLAAVRKLTGEHRVRAT